MATIEVIETIFDWQQGFTKVVRPQILECDYLIYLINRMNFVAASNLRRPFNFQIGRGNIFLLPLPNPRTTIPHTVTPELAEQVRQFAIPPFERLVNCYQILINCIPTNLFERILPIERWLRDRWYPKIQFDEATLAHHAKTLHEKSLSTAGNELDVKAETSSNISNNTKLKPFHSHATDPQQETKTAAGVLEGPSTAVVADDTTLPPINGLTSLDVNKISAALLPSSKLTHKPISRVDFAPIGALYAPTTESLTAPLPEVSTRPYTAEEARERAAKVAQEEARKNLAMLKEKGLLSSVASAAASTSASDKKGLNLKKGDIKNTQQHRQRVVAVRREGPQSSESLHHQSSAADGVADLVDSGTTLIKDIVRHGQRPGSATSQVSLDSQESAASSTTGGGGKGRRVIAGIKLTQQSMPSSMGYNHSTGRDHTTDGISGPSRLPLHTAGSQNHSTHTKLHNNITNSSSSGGGGAVHAHGMSFTSPALQVVLLDNTPVTGAPYKIEEKYGVRQLVWVEKMSVEERAARMRVSTATMRRDFVPTSEREDEAAATVT